MAIFTTQVIPTDDYEGFLDLADIVHMYGHAELVDITDDGDEIWTEDGATSDGRHYSLVYKFPAAVVPRDEVTGDRLDDDGLLPWEQKYICKAGRID